MRTFEKMERVPRKKKEKEEGPKIKSDKQTKILIAFRYTWDP